MGNVEPYDSDVTFEAYKKALPVMQSDEVEELNLDSDKIWVRAGVFGYISSTRFDPDEPVDLELYCDRIKEQCDTWDKQHANDGYWFSAMAIAALIFAGTLILMWS